MKKVSIIVTAYNVSKYIRKCILSLYSQTYKNIEIIIIEDSSTDSTSQIIEDIINNDIANINTIVIHNEYNMGAGASRRKGVEYSTGDYTIFVDGDDYLEVDCIENLVKVQNKYNSDITYCGINIVDSEYNLTKVQVFSKVKEEIHIEEMDRLTFLHDYPMRYLNNMLIKSTLWDKVKYCRRRFIEDIPTMYKLFYYANSIVGTQYIGCNYYQRDDSLVHSSDTIKLQIYQMLTIIELLQFFKNKNEKFYSEILGWASKVKLALTLNLKLHPNKIDEYKEHINIIKSYISIP